MPLVHPIELVECRFSDLVRDPHAGVGQPDADARNQSVDNAGDHLDLCAAHISIALNSNKWREGCHEAMHVTGHCRYFRYSGQRNRESRREIGEQQSVSEAGQLGQAIGRPNPMTGLGIRRVLNAIAPEARLNDRHGEFGAPLQLPVFVERTPPRAGWQKNAPVDVEQRQPVQKPAAPQAHWFAQIQVQVARGCLRL